MPDWISNHDTLLWWLAAGSVLMFISSLIAIPILIVRLPPDYFVYQDRQGMPWRSQHPVLRLTALGAKNALGALFLIVGATMLVLPGQGLLTIMVGLILLDFPGKFKLERWFVARRGVLRSMNWLRTKANRPPLVVLDDS